MANTNPIISAPQTHLLAYPFPTSGHVIPLLDLTKNLISRSVHVTLLLTPSTHHLVPTNHSPLLHTLLLPEPILQNPNQNKFIGIVSFMRQHHYPIILNWAKLHPLPPTAIISDFFLGWTHLLAQDIHVPRLVFSPSGVFAYSVSLTLWRDKPEHDNPFDPEFVVSFPNIPNSPVYHWWQFSPMFRENRGEPAWEILRENFLLNQDSWGIVFNSFLELEPAYFTHMKKEFGHERVWAVGPVLPVDSDTTGSEGRGGASTVSCDNLTTWLDKLDECSVVYVCFGSQTVVTKTQMEVLKNSLELSGVHYILSVGKIPSGFLQEESITHLSKKTTGKGFLIEGWAPQLVILSHRAVGSFLTHCGWNSLLEGLVSGVVMLTWPMVADQYTNAKLLVDELHVGVRVAEGDKKVPEVSEIAKIVKESLGRTEERVRALELRDYALRAIEKNGSSYKQLDELVKELNDVKN